MLAAIAMGSNWWGAAKAAEDVPAVSPGLELIRLPPTDASTLDENFKKSEILDADFHWADQFCKKCKEHFSWNKGQWKVVPFGSLEMQMLNTSEEVTGRTTVVYVNQKSTLGLLPQNNISGQPSSLGFDFSGPKVGALEAGGRIFMNFMGDRPLLNESTPFLINAFGELHNDDCRFVFGQYFSLVNPLDPTLINFGGGIDTGNLASYRGQFRFERYFHQADNILMTTQIAASQQFVPAFITYEDETEEDASDNGLPNLEGRIAIALGPRVEGQDTRVFELGISGMVGQIRALHAGHKYTLIQDMFGCDAQLSARRVGLRGEFFYGQALGSYGGGIGQSLNNSTESSIRDTGGWLEIWTKPVSCVIAAVGYGMDHPLESDLYEARDALRTYNEVYYFTVLWDVTDIFNVGLEVDYRRTGWMVSPPTMPGIRLFEDNDAFLCFFRIRLTF